MASDLTLGCKVVQQEAIKPFPYNYHHNQQNQAKKLEEYVKALEEERHKIDAFKRELPFCMQLLNDAIEASKEYLEEYRLSPVDLGSSLEHEHKARKPVLEEFIPINTTRRASENKTKTEDHENEDEDCFRDEYEHEQKRGNYSDKGALSDSEVSLSSPKKMNWMPQQLWSQHSSEASQIAQLQQERDERWNGGSPTTPPLRHGGSSGAFAPFVRSSKQWEQLTSGAAELRLASCSPSSSSPSGMAVHRNLGQDEEQLAGEMMLQQMPGSGNNSSSSNNNNLNHNQQRKTRRCWSPDLHRRFVNALQQLGGSQVATPKQIRELMKVDGLTNDEVKSHLQKYRLHTRRPSTQGAAPQSPQVVVLGSIWVPPEYAAAAAAAAQNSSMFEASSAAQQDQQQQQQQQDFFTSLKQAPTQLHLHPSTIFYDQQQQQHHFTEQFSAGGRSKSCDSPRSLRDHSTKAAEEEDDGDVTEAEDSRGSDSLALQIGCTAAEA